MESKDILKRVSDALGKKASEAQANKDQMEKERRELVTSVGKNIADALLPYMQQMAEKSQVTKEDLKAALAEVQINVPESRFEMPEIKVPEAKVTVSMPEIKIPPISVPQANIQYPDRMNVSLGDIDNLKPLPVMMMDTKGRPMSFPAGSTGGKADFLTIKDIKTSTGASWFNDEGLRVSGSFSVTASNSSTQAIDSDGSPYTVANPFPVQVVSGGTATSGVNVVDSSGVAYSGSNPVPVVITSGASATTAVQNLNADGTYRDSFPVQGTVTVSSVTASTGVTVLNGEGTARDTWGSSQVGTWNINTVASITASTGVSLLGSDGLAFGTSKPVPVTMVTGVSSSVVANLHDSSGVGYSGSNPLPVTFVAGVSASTASALIDSTGVQYSGSNPVPITIVSGANDTTAALPFEVMTTNRTSKSDGADIRPKADKQGRAMTRISARDLIQTAYTSISTGTEATLLSGAAGFFYDLIYIMGANNSDVAVTVDIRPVTAGNVVLTLQVPANGTAGVSLPVPLPQSGTDTGNNWTADMGDITGTTVYLSALFSKEV